MPETSTDTVSELRAAVERAAGSVRGEGRTPEPSLERPPKPELGDYSSNAAMLLAAAAGAQPPREVAEAIAAELREELGESVERIEVAGPGFVNLFLSDAWFAGAIRATVRRPVTRLAAAPDAKPGSGSWSSSSPPTRPGPLTAASGRHAAFGDAVARLQAAVGHEVGREYYVNDQGGQIERFAASIAAAMSGGAVPEDGYKGAYISELAGQLAADGVGPVDLDIVARRGVERMLEQIRGSLHRYGVDFDTWTSERRFHESGKVTAALDQLRETGHTYESEGATVAADHRVRRRQGPCPAARRRLADLLRGRCRIPLGEA